MGYYDEDSRYERRRAPRRGSYMWTALISAVIGGLLVLGLSPFILQQQPGAEPQPKADVARDKDQVDNKEQVKAVSVKVTDNIVDAVDKARPAVVGVVNVTRGVDPWTRDEQSMQQGTGSGAIFEKKGGKARIVTNNHVVEGADRLEVVLSDGTHVPAELVGTDELTDLAVLEIDAAKVKAVAEFGDSSHLRVGEPAIAIGNPLGLEFSQTVTSGVISAVDRSIQVNKTNSIHVVQTDAAINPGNSGGPLVNIAGQVIGINSLKIAQQGIEGLGFAIPINDAKPIIRDLMAHGRVIRPHMGVRVTGLDVLSMQQRRMLNLPNDIEEAVFVYQVDRGSPAYDGGVRQNDVIVKLDETKVAGPAELQSYLHKEKKVGDKMKVTLYRDGKKMTTEMTLGETPLNLLQ